ncbi:MAG: endonuclease III domain-containing protein [Mariprofundales bacterium]|nr:endonuclease III domain-containing protein [Mariprofundales bacterium]
MKVLFNQLLAAYGSRHWWPAESPFEMMVGAILTQNTSWTNVERAIAALKSQQWLDAEALINAPLTLLEQAVRPAGYFRQKSARLQIFSRFFLDQGGVEGMRQLPLTTMRTRLLAVHGVGPETADSILLYALEQPIFIIDTYTKRLMQRLEMINPPITYHGLQNHFHHALSPNTGLFQEFHALIIEHGKRHCAAKPKCDGCPLVLRCPSAD